MSGMRGLLTAEEFRKVLRMKFPEEDGWTHEHIGKRLRLSAGFVGMVLSGHRQPSKAALKALKMEKVVFYRAKVDPFGLDWHSSATRND